jgi:hypothetical protein
MPGSRRKACMTENTSAFIGLEDNDAGRKFRDRVIQAVQEAKK